MDTTGILRPDELPFPVTDLVAETINELLAAMERDDHNLDCYLDMVEADARDLPPEHDIRVRRYYADWGWSINGVDSI